MSWKTVPNFFPDWDYLSSRDRYNLIEGYSIQEYTTKDSGKYYKKVRLSPYDSPDRFPYLLDYLGFTNWHLEWRPKKTILGKFFGCWEKIK